MAATGRATIVVVGSGIAGLSAVRAIRTVSPAATVLLVNGEGRLPYKRTQLSKFLQAGFEPNQFALEPETWYQTNAVDVIHGTWATTLDPAARTLTLSTGRVLAWDRLILATGATPRWPAAAPGGLPGLYVLRDADHAEALLQALATCRSVLILGMGVLGIEVAEQARRRGLETTLIHRGQAPMERDLTPAASQRLHALLAAHGVRLVYGATVSRIVPTAAGLHACWDGGEAVAERVVACVGTAPNTALAAAAGLAVDRGILVDGQLRTSCPDVFAAGDCAQLPGGAGCHLWHCAEALGRTAGRNAAGTPTPYAAKPFRLKCEVFSDYLFSMNRPDSGQLADLDVEEDATGAVYRCLFFRANGLDGVVMAGDKDRAKRYEQAVWEHWPRARVRAELPLA